MWGDRYSTHRDAPRRASVAELSAVLAAGIDFRIVRTRPGTDRQFDRHGTFATALVSTLPREWTDRQQSAIIAWGLQRVASGTTRPTSASTGVCLAAGFYPGPGARRMVEISGAVAASTGAPTAQQPVGAPSFS
jgi:hypothetical protein